MKRAAIVTPWFNLPTGRFPLVFTPNEYPLAAGESWQDVTGQPAANLTPAPNQYTVTAVLSEDKLAAIQGDATYLVLWVTDA